MECFEFGDKVTFPLYTEHAEGFSMSVKVGSVFVDLGRPHLLVKHQGKAMLVERDAVRPLAAHHAVAAFNADEQPDAIRKCISGCYVQPCRCLIPDS